MKKSRFNKRGFTLTEILIVVSIIIIVSAAAFVGVAVTLKNSEETNKRLKNEHDVGLFESEAWKKVKSYGADQDPGDTSGTYIPEEGTSESTVSTEEETSANIPSEESTEGSTSSESSEEPAETTKKGTPSDSLTGPKTVGPYTASNGYVTPGDNCPRGVVSMSESGEVVLCEGSNNTEKITLKRNDDGSYDMTIDSGSPWVFQQQYGDNPYPGFPGFKWGNWNVKNLSGEQKAWLSDKYGLELS